MYLGLTLPFNHMISISPVFLVFLFIFFFHLQVELLLTKIFVFILDIIAYIVDLSVFNSNQNCVLLPGIQKSHTILTTFTTLTSTFMLLLSCLLVLHIFNPIRCSCFCLLQSILVRIIQMFTHFIVFPPSLICLLESFLFV